MTSHSGQHKLSAHAGNLHTASVATLIPLPILFRFFIEKLQNKMRCQIFKFHLHNFAAKFVA